MAKKKQTGMTARVKRSQMSSDQLIFLEGVAEEVVRSLDDVPLEVDGAPMATVKYPDGSFKKKTIMAGWNFFMQSAYIGARGDIIFNLTPEDAQEYEAVEFTSKTMDSIFPMAGTELSKKLPIKGENFNILVDELIVFRAKEIEAEESIAEEIYKDVDGYGAF